MVKHIVMYTFKEGVDKNAAIGVIEGALMPLVGKIPGLQHLEVRLAYSGMDYALYSEFESKQALEEYRIHPLHLAAKEKFHHYIGSRVAADYEV